MVLRFLEEGARVGVLERFADRVAQLRTDFGTYVLLASRTSARGITGVVMTADAASSLRWSRPSWAATAEMDWQRH